MREMSRSLDAMYYDYDVIIIIIIFITIHTTAKVKYTDIRNFIDGAFLCFIPLPRRRPLRDRQFPFPSLEDVIASFVDWFNGKPLLLIRTLVINSVANAISVFIVLRDAYHDYELSTRTRRGLVRFLGTCDRISLRIPL